MAEVQRVSHPNPALSQRQFTAILRLLPSLKSGSLTMSVNRLPMLRVDPGSRSLSVEVAGIRESGFKLGKMLVGRGDERSIRRLLTSSEGLAKKLSEIGWTLTLYDGSSGLLSMGSRVSRLTGHIKTNPLKLRKLLRML